MYKYKHHGKSKYNSKKTEVDGIRFDSLKEARRWKTLRLLEESGEIADLQRQVRFTVIPEQRIDGKVVERKTEYIADFTYTDRLTGKTVVEDTKKQLFLEAENPFKKPKTPLKVYSYDQSKHIVGGQKYNEYMETHKYPPSYLTITEEKAQEFIDKYHGTGILQLDKNGNILPNEMIIDNDITIGYAVNNYNGKEVATTGFKIHYSDKGTHIVPMYANQKLSWLEKREHNGHDWLLRQKG